MTGSTKLIYKGKDGTSRAIDPDNYALKSEVEGVVGEMNDELVKYGKEMISEAITDQGIDTSATDLFETMATNIRALKVGGGGNALLVLSAFPNWSINYKSTEADIDETITLEDNEYYRIVPVTKGYIYTVIFTGGDSTVTKQVSVADSDKYYCAPKIDFTYTGNSNVRDDGVVELLTSGNITFNAEYNLDVFLVGGGGGANYSKTGGGCSSGGGGGGYTKTVKNVKVGLGSLSATIGAGGSGGVYSSRTSASDGKSTSFDTYDVAGGLCSTGTAGGNGGSGGAAPGYTEEYGPGKRGVDGGNGTKGSSSGSYGTYGTPGTGQGTTTREFGESTGKLYADGGAGGGSSSGSQGPGEGGGGGAGSNSSTGTNNGAGGPGATNTGGGGGGSGYARDGGAGGSGIICLRLHKEEYLLSGTWTFRDSIPYIALDEDVNFTSNGTSYTHFSNRYTSDNLHNLIFYGTTATPETNGVYYYDTTSWVNTAYRTITFTDENSVSHAFYTWFINNAIKTE